MKTVVKITIIFIACSVLILSFGACGEKASARDIISALAKGEASLPAGNLYVLSAREGEKEHLSDQMLLSLYGFDRSLSGLSDAAILLSGGFHPCEFAVFHCNTANSAEDIALRLKNRIKLLRENAETSAAICGMETSAYLSYIESAAVIITGNTVALLISSDVKNARHILRRQL